MKDNIIKTDNGTKAMCVLFALSVPVVAMYSVYSTIIQKEAATAEYALIMLPAVLISIVAFHFELKKQNRFLALEETQIKVCEIESGAVKIINQIKVEDNSSFVQKGALGLYMIQENKKQIKVFSNAPHIALWIISILFAGGWLVMLPLIKFFSESQIFIKRLNEFYNKPIEAQKEIKKGGAIAVNVLTWLFVGYLFIMWLLAMLMFVAGLFVLFLG